MKKKITLTATLLLLGLIVAPMPAHAGWNAMLRYFGEYWSDGYHSQGDPWNRPTKHAKQLSSYQPYYPAYQPPMPAPQEVVPTPAKQNVTAVSSGTPVMIIPAK